MQFKPDLKSLQNKKVQLIIGIGIILILLVSVLIFVNSKSEDTDVVNKSETELTSLFPEVVGTSGDSVLITNLTDVSATIIWATQDEEVGYVQYKTENGDFEKAQDQRISLSNTKRDYKTHSILLNYLKPETKYIFEVYSNDIKIAEGTFTTYKTGNTPPTLDLIYGKLWFGSNADALIVLQLTNEDPQKTSNLISTLVVDGGDWYTSLGGIRDVLTGEYYETTHNTQLTVTSFAPGSQNVYKLPLSEAKDRDIKLFLDE